MLVICRPSLSLPVYVALCAREMPTLPACVGIRHSTRPCCPIIITIMTITYEYYMGLCLSVSVSVLPHMCAPCLDYKPSTLNCPRSGLWPTKCGSFDLWLSGSIDRDVNKSRFYWHFRWNHPLFTLIQLSLHWQAEPNSFSRFNPSARGCSFITFSPPHTDPL